MRESEVKATGSRGERLLGGTVRARSIVLGSELDQAIRKRKRLEADLEKQRALVTDLTARKQAEDSVALEFAGGAAEGPAPKRPRRGAT